MENETIGFTLVGIKTEQFALFEENYSPEKKAALDSAFNFKLNTEAKQIGVFTTFQFEQGKKVFIKLSVSCHFSVKDDAWKKFMQEKEIIFPEGFARHLCMLSTGTARGILHAKTEGTVFNSFLLPTININEMLKSDVVFQLET